jgi:hypothetical protein
VIDKDIYLITITLIIVNQSLRGEAHKFYMLASHGIALFIVRQVKGFHRYKSASLYHISVILRNVNYVLNPAHVPL